MRLNLKIIGFVVFCLAGLALFATRYVRPVFFTCSSCLPYIVNDGGKFYVQLGITIVLGLAAVFVILSKRRYQAGEKHWAYGTLGLIVGFWLKGDSHPPY